MSRPAEEEGRPVDVLAGALEREGCGFVGAFPNAPSAPGSERPADVPPPDRRIDLWDGPVRPERVRPGGEGDGRWLA